MDSHVLEFYSAYEDENSHGHFHQVIALHDHPPLDWEDVSILCPRLPKGWFELACLSKEDRIDFTREFWLTKMPYHPDFSKFLTKFFSFLDDIGIFLTKRTFDDPFEPNFVYSLADDSGFFHGEPPALDNELAGLQSLFPDYILPEDYMAFLKIHNGFAKLTDTGIMKSAEMEETYSQFQEMLKNQDPLVTSTGQTVNPKSLIPFYKSFGMPFFQCFWGEWYPSHEMGNVYYSGLTKTISDCTKSDPCLESMAFETFTDWLMFYLEKID